MRIKSGILCCLLWLSLDNAQAQSAAAVYEKSLHTVLKEIQRYYSVVLDYDTGKALKKMVSYADWRYKTDIQSTLSSVLGPLDMVWEATGKDSFYIRSFEYYKRDTLEGKRHLAQLLLQYPGLPQWEQRKAAIKACFLSTLGINPSIKRSPLQAIFRSKRMMKGYTVENVAFESIPGYFVCGSLYRPIGKGKHPAILCPHGHFYNNDNHMLEDERGRYRPDMQYRCAALAKMGAIVFDYDMYGYGESTNQTGGFAFHETGFALAIQTWNSIRALDFLESLPDTDTSRLGVTGASGGGTQSFILTALDNRIAASCPVVMVSASFYGGCNCESGLPIHSCLHTNNAEIAAMAAPRPQLVVSDGNDWTRTVPTIEYPYLQKVYNLYDKATNISNTHLPNDHHDYGYSKRVPMYYFFASVFKLDIAKISNPAAVIDESGIAIEKAAEQYVFDKAHPMPPQALKSHAAIVEAFRVVQSGN
jgi:dienelactone hydrolase